MIEVLFQIVFGTLFCLISSVDLLVFSPVLSVIPQLLVFSNKSMIVPANLCKLQNTNN